MAIPQRTSFYLTDRTKEDLDFLCAAFNENRSQVMSRLIALAAQSTYKNQQQESKNEQ